MTKGSLTLITIKPFDSNNAYLMFKKYTFLLAGHYTLTPGPQDKLYRYLAKKGSRLYYIQFPLYPQSGIPTLIKTPTRTIKLKIPPSLQYIFEGVIVWLKFRKVAKKREKFDFAICADSLSYFHIFVLRRFFGVKRIIYFNVDYTTRRFGNFFLNWLYIRLNKFAYHTCDYLFYLIPQYLEQMDPQRRKSDKAFFFKHWIIQSKVRTKRKKRSLIFAGNLVYAIDFVPLFQALQILRSRNISFSLDIYGEGDTKKQVLRQVETYNLGSHVRYKGLVDNDTLTRSILKKYEIGVCPYILKAPVGKSDHMFNLRDLSTKLTEYIGAGLPIITTPLIKEFSVVEKENFGFLVKTSEDWYKALHRLLTDPRLRLKYSANALAYSRRYDAEAILTPVFRKLLTKLQN